MCACSGEGEAVLGGDAQCVTPEVADLSGSIVGVDANVRRQLDDRCEELVFRLAPVGRFRLDDHGGLADLLQRRRVEDHQLFLDTHREGAPPVGFDGHCARIPCTGRPAASHA